jgi:hypothetical protein
MWWRIRKGSSAVQLVARDPANPVATMYISRDSLRLASG